jgi:hypothetical protein
LLTVLAAAALCPLSCTQAAARTGFEVFRAVHYDVGDDARGSRAAALGLKARLAPGFVALPKPAQDAEGSPDDSFGEESANEAPKKKRRRRRARLPLMNRNVLVVDFASATQPYLEQLLDERKAAGLLLVLPEGYDDPASTSPSQLKTWLSLEQWLLRREVKVPVYFTVQSSATDSLKGDLAGLDGGADGLLLTLDESSNNVKPSVLKRPLSPSLNNIQGWLPTSDPDTDPEYLPTVAVVAHYDTFGLIPGLSRGGGSGAVALLEIARLFAQLYTSSLSSSSASHNLLFVITSGGHTNFAGARDWLDVVDGQLIDSIDFALCLDDLDIDGRDDGAPSNEFYLHFSKNPQKDATIRKVLSAFDAAATGIGDGTRVVPKRKRINLKNPHLAWEHEQFAMKRIVAATLSGRSVPPEPFRRGSSFVAASSRKVATQTRLKRAVQLVAEALAKTVFPALRVGEVGRDDDNDNNGGHRIFTGALSVDGNYVDAWTDYMGSVPRSVPFMAEGGASPSPTVDVALEKALGAHVAKTETYDFVLGKSDATPFTFYGATHGRARAVLVKGVAYDLSMTLIVFAYLIVLWAYISVEVDGYKGFRQRVPYMLRNFMPKPSETSR